MTLRTDAELTGTIAVVTGSSSGIGRAIALELACAGAAVLVHARGSREAAQRVVDKIRADGGEATLVLADLATQQGPDLLISQAWDWHDRVDLWINNAGADVLTGEGASWTFQRKLNELFRVDVVATIALSRQIGQRMKAQGGGVLLNIGWDQAEHGMAGDSGQLFAAAKGAVMAFTKSLAKSLAPEVRVNCLAPGWIKTAWGEGASAHWQQRATDECALGRWGTAEDVARVARFLASPAAGFINGQTVVVNGGFAP